jgi:hypothetical protein
MIFLKIIKNEYNKLIKNENEYNKLIKNENEYKNTSKNLLYFISAFDNITREIAIIADKNIYLKSKYFIFKNFLFNTTISTANINCIIDFYCHCQHKYFALIKFKHRIIIRNSKPFENICDLKYEPLDRLISQHKVSLIENKKHYVFSIFHVI